MADHKWSERTSYDGNKVNWGLRYILMAAVIMLSDPYFGGEKTGITVHQGCWSFAKASAGTHSGPSAVDTSSWNWRNRVLVLRLLGVAAWFRAKSRSWIAHIHGIVCGDDNVHWLAARQVIDYWRTPPGDGLGSVGGKDDNGPKMYGARPLFVLPWKSYAVSGRTLVAVKACHAYTRQTPKAPHYPKKAAVAVGDQFKAVATTRDEKTGDLWFVTKDGRCLYRDNFEVAA